MSGKEGLGEGHCWDRRDSCEHPGGRGKDNGERRGNGAYGGENGACLGDSGRKKGNLRRRLMDTMNRIGKGIEGIGIEELEGG